MLTYILRRLGAGLLLVAVVTMVTFAIFYVVPRWAGRTTEQLATMYVGRAPTPEAIQATIERLGLDQPIAVQFWEFVRGIFFGAQYQFGRDTIECAAPCFGYSFQTYQEVFPEIVSRLPVTVIAPVARYLGPGDRLGPHVHVFDLLPAHRLGDLIDASVIHGGEGTLIDLTLHRSVPPPPRNASGPGNPEHTVPGTGDVWPDGKGRAEGGSDESDDREEVAPAGRTPGRRTPAPVPAPAPAVSELAAAPSGQSPVPTTTTAPTMPTLSPKLRNSPRMSFSMAIALSCKSLRAVSRARRFWLVSVLTCTGRNRLTRIIWAMPRASMRSDLFGCAFKNALVCRVSTQVTGNPASTRPLNSHCDSGPASNPIRLKW